MKASARRDKHTIGSLKKKASPEAKAEKDILSALEYYCAYRERCLQEVREKLLDLSTASPISKEEEEQLLLYLKNENYVNEQRYAESFIRGHVAKGWGLKKIRYHLKLKSISETDIRIGLAAIDEVLYQEKLHQQLSRKWESLAKEKSHALREQKLFRFALQKGYDMEEIKSVMKEWQ